MLPKVLDNPVDAITQQIAGMVSPSDFAPAEQIGPTPAQLPQAPEAVTPFNMGASDHFGGYQSMALRQGQEMFTTAPSEDPAAASKKLGLWMYYQKMINNPDTPLDDSPEYAGVNGILMEHRQALASLAQPIALPPSHDAERQQLYGQLLSPVPVQRPANFQDVDPRVRLFMLARAISNLVTGHGIGDTAVNADTGLQWAQQNVVNPQYQADVANRGNADMVAKAQLGDISRQEGMDQNAYTQEVAQRQREKEDIRQNIQRTFEALLEHEDKARALDVELSKAQTMAQSKGDPVLNALFKRAQGLKDNNSDPSDIAESYNAVASYYEQQMRDPSLSEQDTQSAAMNAGMFRAIAKREAARTTTFQQGRQADAKLKGAEASAYESLTSLRSHQVQWGDAKVQQGWQALTIASGNLAERMRMGAALRDNIASVIGSRGQNDSYKAMLLKLRANDQNFKQTITLTTKDYNAALNGYTVAYNAVQADVRAKKTIDPEKIAALQAAAKSLQDVKESISQMNAMHSILSSPSKGNDIAEVQAIADALGIQFNAQGDAETAQNMGLGSLAAPDSLGG